MIGVGKQRYSLAGIFRTESRADIYCDFNTIFSDKCNPRQLFFLKYGVLLPSACLDFLSAALARTDTDKRRMP
jgi:hypothetical protein